MRNAKNHKADVLILQRPHAAASDYYDGAVIPQHVAFLQFVCDDAGPDCQSPGTNPRTTDLMFERGGVQYGVIFLAGDDVTIDGTQSLADLSGSLCDKANNCVPSMNRKVCKQCGLLMSPDSATSAGLVHLTTGALSVDVTQGDGSEWCIRNDKPKAATCRQQLPQEVKLSLALNAVTFLFDGPKGKQSLSLTGTNLRVVIGSATLDDLLGLGNAHEMVDHHFEVYYDMLDGHVPLHPPIPHLVVAGKAHHEIEPLFLHGANCPPVSYDP